MSDPTRPGWLLLYDYCMRDGYGVSCSSDLLHWTVEKGVAFPPEARRKTGRLLAVCGLALLGGLVGLG